MLKVSPETALRYTKFSVALMFTWPPWPEASKTVKILFDFFSWIFIGISSLLVILLCNASLYQQEDYLTFTKTICLAVSSSQAVIKMLVCKGQRPRLEMLHCRVKDFIKNATSHEREILQRYVDRCGPVHLAVNVCSMAASIAMICGPLMLPQPLPTDAKYPFSVEDRPGRDLAYLHQAIVGLQCAEIGSVDCQAALLIWFAGARLELLAKEFRNVTSSSEFNVCVRKHQILLKDTEEMIRAVRFVILTTVVMTMFSITFGGIHIVSKEPLLVKSQFLIIDIGFASILFLSAWPAENLLSACTAVGRGAYDSPWIADSPDLRKNVLFVLQRSQKPAVISVASVLPELSIAYYSSFLSKTFSFFTTLRIIVGKVEDGT